MKLRLGLLLVSAVSASSLAAFQATNPADAPPTLQLVESAPIETTLDHPDIPNASDVWLDMVQGAGKTLDFAEFYASDEPGSKLVPIVDAIVKAAGRGVKVRFLLEEKFFATYPEIPARLAKVAGVEVRHVSFAGITNGILHAKYFLVDGRETYLGSQNFDWRSLEHIQELGLRIRSPEITRDFAAAFEMDWLAADGKVDAARKLEHASATTYPIALRAASGDVRVTPVYSPAEWIPDASLWELPRLVALVDGARTSVSVQVLTYKMTTRDKSYWDELEPALRRAAARGVHVRLLVADWCKRKGTIEGLQSLEPLQNVEVKLISIPPWSGGFIPYARVCHAKYMVVDAARAWIGTSNWERDYFHESRNVGLIVEGAEFGAVLERFFTDTWGSKYAAEVDPCAQYEAPRTDK